MKKIIAILCLFFCDTAMTQQVDIIVDATKDTYESKSYIITNKLKLTEGFSFNSATDGDLFFAHHLDLGDQRPFVTTWKTDNPGSSATNQITFSPWGVTSYYLHWINEDDPSQKGTLGPYTSSSARIISLPETGTYKVLVTGEIGGMKFSSNGDRDKLISIDQWGDMEWTYLVNAFVSCQNLQITATDAPNLTNITDLSGMFANASSLNSDLNNWDVSNVTNMSNMFSGASSFNGDISQWDVSSVTDMNIMFQNATNFNGDISQWNVSNVTNMRGMFNGASEFNSNLYDWNVSNVENMSLMFLNASNFNSDLSNWNVTNVTNMASMFKEATSFDGDVSTWNTINVELMSSMFEGATSFNQPIGSWDISSVTNMYRMLLNASSFNQSLGGWDIGRINFNLGFLTGTNLSATNYEATLVGWSTVESHEASIPFDISIDAEGLFYCDPSARNILVGNYRWNIDGDLQGCSFSDPFVTTWKTDNPGSTNDTQIRIPTFSLSNYLYEVSWEDTTDPSINGIAGIFTGDATIDFPAPGTYKVSITGIFPAIYFLNRYDKSKLISVEHWGNNRWETMRNAFSGCNNLSILADDVPDLSMVSDMSSMFYSSSINQDISHWDVSAVTNMSSMFRDANSFNQNLDAWDFRSVTNFNSMFLNASSFNQNIGTWQISKTHSIIMEDILLGSGVTADTYDQTLISWSNIIPDPCCNINIDIGQIDVHYCQGADARSYLYSRGWSFNDEGRFCPSGEPFITKWQSNSDGDRVLIPINDWYDGDYYYKVEFYKEGGEIIQYDHVYTNDVSIRFPEAGEYYVSISGEYPSPGFHFSPDKNQLLSVVQWGDMKWESFYYAFSDCENLTINAIDVPDLSLVTDLSHAFRGCSSVNHGLENWDVSTIENMTGLFHSATSFNGDLSTWNMSNVSNANFMFTNTNFNQSLGIWDISNMSSMGGILNNSAMSTENYDQTLIGWSTQQLQDNVWFSADGIPYCNAGAERASIINNFNWTIEDAGAGCAASTPFITTWKTDNTGTTEDNQISFYILGADPSGWTQSYKNYSVHWVNVIDPSINGTSGPFTTSNVTLTFPEAGTYELSISGVFPQFSVSSGDPKKLIEINQWGDNPWQSFYQSFNNTNLSIEATDSPNFSSCSSVNEMFYRAFINGDLSHWDVTTLEDFSGMFKDAYDFNDNIGSWNVSNAKNMSSMFSGTAFNGNISSWDVSGVTNMSNMFYRASNFDNDIGSWDVSSVSDMSNMFYLATNFNADISSWNVANVNSMAGMFQEASSFNIGIGPWDVSGVTNMSRMFKYASNFNQEIGTWNVGNVVSMEEMFMGGVSIPPFSTLTPTVFNHDISNWDVSSVTNMKGMFLNAKVFNQDISSWDVSNVLLMNDMFNSASSFDQSLGNWNVTNVNSMAGMFDASGISQVSYEATLTGWNNLPSLQNGVTIGVTNLFYCTAESARQNMIDTYSWIFSGDERLCPITVPFVTVWKTDNPGATQDNAIVINTSNSYTGKYSYEVNWEKMDDPSIQGNVGPFSGDANITFPAAGEYRVSITGIFPALTFRIGQDANKLLDVEQWGDNEWQTMEEAFRYCSNLEITATDYPDLSQVTSTSKMFQTASGFNSVNVIGWDMSQIIDMSYMFSGASAFNQDISNWDVSNVTDMSYMFASASSFDQNIANWDVSSVSNMKYMFGSSAFNQDISGWDLTNLTNASYMFLGNTNFNQGISTWNMSNVTDMSAMFYSATSFNQDISSWDVSNVITMSNMFRNASSFDQNLGLWNVSNVGSMDGMLNASGVSQSNYELTLSGWSTLDLNETQIPMNLSLGALGLEYCDDSGRSILETTYNWTITGDALNCPAPPVAAKTDDYPNIILSNENPLEVVLYPNPANDFIELIGDMNNASVTIHDLKGNTIASFQNGNTNAMTIDASGIKDGIYLIRIIAKSGELIERKLVVKH